MTSSSLAGGTLDYAAWAIAAPCLDKLTVPQIRSWADFVLLSSGKQPLPSKATNGKRHPLSITDPFLKLTALESCIPKLAAEKQANEAIVECHSCLYAQYKTLRVWHALESCIRSNKDLSLSRQLEAASRIDLASDEKCSEVMADAVTELVEGGHPLRLIIALVADASRRGPVVEPNSPPLPSLDGFLDQSHGDSAAFIARTISNAAKARLVGLFSSSTLDHHSSLTKIHSIALCLQDGFEADGLVLSARNDFWLQVRTKIDNLDASSYSNESSAATVLRLLDLQSLLPKIWPGWNPPSSVGQPGLELDPLGGDETAVLLGRTRLILGGGSLWPHLTLTAIEVGSREAASDLFKSLLAPPLTHDKVERLEQLLAETWAEGKVWKLEKGDDTEGPCSLLHELWRDLALATLSTDSHLAQFAIKVVDRVRHQARCGQIASLSSQDVATLIKASEDKPILHACISFLSPYPPQSLTMALDQHLEPFSEIQLLCLLCAILLPFSQDHSLDPQPIMLLTHKNLWGGIIRSLEYVPLSSSNPLSSLFPTLASALILTGQTSYAAQLTSLKLRLHPSLASLSGGLAFLKSTLKDSLVASSGRHALSRNKSGPGHLLFSIVPHSLDSIQVGVGDICRRALDQFNA